MDLLSAEEKQALIEDLAQMFIDTETVITITYHSTGTETFDTDTGDVTETGGVDVSNIKALRVQPMDTELPIMHVNSSDEIFLIQAADITTVTPKVNDRIIVGSTTKYVHSFSNPMPKIHWRFVLGAQGV